MNVRSVAICYDLDMEALNQSMNWLFWPCFLVSTILSTQMPRTIPTQSLPIKSIIIHRCFHHGGLPHLYGMHAVVCCNITNGAICTIISTNVTKHKLILMQHHLFLVQRCLATCSVLQGVIIRHTNKNSVLVLELYFNMDPFQLVPRSRKCGSMYSLPHTPSWCIS
jgi:hypothetical protein